MNKNISSYITYAALAVVLYLIIKAVMNRMDSPKPGKIAIPTASGGGVIVPTNFTFDPAKVDRAKTFGLGSKNSQEVAYLQRWLNQYYSNTLKVDGDFGSRTLAALLLAKPAANTITNTLNDLGV